MHEDLIEAVELLDCDGFADRERVGYRLRVRRPEGQYLVEQQAYLSERDGQIGWLRIMCSGFRRVIGARSSSSSVVSDLRH